MAIDAKTVKELRDRTGLPMMQCKKALLETDGNIDAASDYLRKQGAKTAEKRAHRDTGDGLVGSYVHHDGKTGVLIEVNCETDFVAKSDDFKGLVNDLCLQIAATAPLVVKREDLDPAVVDKERDILLAQLDASEKDSGKPEQVKEKIIDGRMNKFCAERVLLEQQFVKDGDRTITELVQSTIQKTGENITIRHFARFKIGE